MPPFRAARMLLVKKGGNVHQWMRLFDWTWIGAMMIAWILLIAVVGYAAVFVASRQSARHPVRHGRPKSA